MIWFFRFCKRMRKKEVRPYIESFIAFRRSFGREEGLDDVLFSFEKRFFQSLASFAFLFRMAVRRTVH